MPISKDLLDFLVCSFCKADLRLEGERLLCTNPECGLIYAIEDDIPNMLIDEARRPCPKCGQQRDWNEDVLCCPKCGATLRYGR
jgi:uncharacterized protein YbaR (Trm112 family)